MKRNGRDPAVRMAELLVRSTLANFHESELPEDADDFSRFENRELWHLTYLDKLRAHELSFDLRFSIFEEQRQNFAEVCI